MDERPVPRRTVTAVVASGHHAAVFDALCALGGVEPHELVAEIVRRHLDSRACDPVVQALIRRSRLSSSGLSIVGPR